jgi:hypothetical protein
MTRRIDDRAGRSVSQAVLLHLADCRFSGKTERSGMIARKTKHRKKLITVRVATRHSFLQSGQMFAVINVASVEFAGAAA